mmetsp:Transcript_16726/g.54282  ORF Transcript_16726/g.54282 Transcript_16726/m.54282 type:complete len:273 (+) Transcript_16726:86-904(+)
MCGIGVVLYHSRTAEAAGSATTGIPVHALQRRGPDAQGELVVGRLEVSGYELRLTAAVLHLRGRACQPQPLQSAAGDVLLWNGEVFGGGVAVADGESDTARLLAVLRAAGEAVPEVLESVHGPWALAYWHAASRTLWYGRDGLGRRSLVRMEGADAAAGCSTLRLCSVAVPLPASAGGEWEELPACGIGCVRLLPDGTASHLWLPRRAPPPPAPRHYAIHDVTPQGMPPSSVRGHRGALGVRESLRGCVSVRTCAPCPCGVCVPRGSTAECA